MLGRPIAHSASPALHRAAYQALDLVGWTYDAIDCGAEELPELVGSAGPEWAGFSVTMPGKRAALDVAHHRSAVAELVGAANTLLPGPDGWTATNTDVDGIVGALSDELASGLTADRHDGPDGGPVDRAGDTIAILGAGGTAQAALVAVTRMGAGELHILVRDRSRTSELQATADRLGATLRVHELASADADRVLGAADLVISTLPAGAADPLARRPWHPRTVVLDVVYAGGPTPLARAVTSSGGRVVAGAEVLLHQAAEQVRLMTGRSAPLAVMRAALPAPPRA